MRETILIAGYGWSGSSAVVDLLKEYDNIDFFNDDFEFRIIKDPGGLEDLRYHLTKEWDSLQVDEAICRFKNMTSMMNRKERTLFGRIIQPGMGLRSLTNGDFYKATQVFLNRIINFRYCGTWFGKQYQKSKMDYLRLKIKKKFGRYNEYLFFSDISEEDFTKYAKEYIDRILRNSGINNNEKMVLDQAIPPQNPYMADNYFDDWKMIIVDRNPEDILASMIKRKALIGDELATNLDLDKYIKWHKAYRRNVDRIKKHPKVLLIQFEELVNDYNNQVARIEDYLEIDSKSHINEGRYFDVEESKKNIGKYKEVLSRDDVNYLRKKLC